MKVSARLVPLVFMVLAIVTAGAATMQDKAGQTASMAEAAQAFLDSLTPEQRSAAMFPFNSDDRFDWHYIPRERKGVSLKAMSGPQKKAALALVEASLSAEGYDKSERIRQLEQILFDREGRAIRDTELYFFMIFGEPTADGSWGWRYEGHHISGNWTVHDGMLASSTPQFFGTNPAYVREGSRAGERVLVLEDILPRSLHRLDVRRPPPGRHHLRRGPERHPDHLRPAGRDPGEHRRRLRRSEPRPAGHPLGADRGVRRGAAAGDRGRASRQGEGGRPRRHPVRLDGAASRRASRTTTACRDRRSSSSTTTCRTRRTTSTACGATSTATSAGTCSPPTTSQYAHDAANAN